MAGKFKVPDYTAHKSISAALTDFESPLNDFPFTDSLLYDSQFEVDSQPVLTAGLFRTSRGPDRVQMSARNQFGNQQGGIYVYVDNLLTTSYGDGTISFYDSSGVVTSFIQDQSGTLYEYGNAMLLQSASTLALEGSEITLTALVDVIITAPLVTISGALGVNGLLAGDRLGITDGVAAPATIAGLAQIYVDTADGDLKVKFGDGTVKTIVTD